MNTITTKDHRETAATAGRLKRLAIWYLKNIDKISCVGLLVFWSTYTTFYVGEMPSSAGPYTWHLPFQMLLLLLPPVYFAYCAGKNDAKQLDSLDAS